MRRRNWITLTMAAAPAVMSAIFVASCAPAAESVGDDPGRLSALVGELSDDDYSTRDGARRSLLNLAGDAAAAARVRAAVAARLVERPGDFELRSLLEELRMRYPAAAAQPPAGPAPTDAQLDAWLQAVESPSFVERDGAFQRLLQAAQAPETSTKLMLKLKGREAGAVASVDGTKRLDAVWQAAWRSWLLSEFKPASLPAVADADIDAAIDRLLQAVAPAAPDVPSPASRYEAARRELLYLLARDDLLPRVRAKLQQRIAPEQIDKLPLAAIERLQEVYDWSRPAMVAEFWQNGRNLSIQHLILGVPNQPAGAPKPSLFDKCDERFAHCVSGNSLSPGDWPVGVFFPHPSDLQGDTQFHLKNLPTPRRRLAYEVEVPVEASGERQQQVDFARRKAITRNTCARWLEDKHLLTDRELDMLVFLDADELSAFAGPYLSTVPDVRIPHDSPTPFGNGSSHGLFCYKLAVLGTAAAGPALTKAIDKRQVLEPLEATPYRMDWIALLVLAERTEWPGLDEWLAAHIADTGAVNIREPEAADVGASAAALLVQKQRGSPSEFGLQRHAFAELIDLENPGFRFTKPEGRAAVERWWRERKTAQLPKNSP